MRAAWCFRDLPEEPLAPPERDLPKEQLAPPELPEPLPALGEPTEPAVIKGTPPGLPAPPRAPELSEVPMRGLATSLADAALSVSEQFLVPSELSQITLTSEETATSKSATRLALLRQSKIEFKVLSATKLGQEDQKGTQNQKQGGCAGRDREVQFAKRILVLEQLNTLSKVFAESEWLQQKCNAYNQSNREKIKDGTVFAFDANLYAIDHFIVRPLTDPERCAEIPEALRLAARLPQPEQKCSYSGLVNPQGAALHIFVSHYWGHIFQRTLLSLRAYAHQSAARLQCADSARMSFWICLFALNQHRLAEQLDDSPETGPFNAALAAASGGAVMVIDEDLKPLKRIWCLYETHRVMALGKEFNFINEDGALSCSSAAATHANFLKQLVVGAGQIRVFQAESSNQTDKFQIWYLIGNPWFRTQHNSFEEFQRELALKGKILANYFSDFEFNLRQQIAKCLLEVAVTSQEHELVIRCASLAPPGTAKALRYLVASGVDLAKAALQSATATPMACLPSNLAHIGDVESLEIVRSCGVDLGMVCSKGWTAWLDAARRGHWQVLHLLLEAGVDRTVCDPQYGRTALFWAAQYSHLEALQLLVYAGLDVDARDHKGEVAAHLAAKFGHVEALQVLLNADADVMARDNAGKTPADWASEQGHLSVVQWLQGM
eukprot:TRINITY_DN13866_c0_g1_i1.p1 TRINITY_DN13866_c0_g1~~TRINITY_DN13866_c0_g1_i1.p1  ORF type:complete len:665 (+),score=120.02 TRINITY_DN13866_c0_g1_i1:48-2042(+)